jgi:hypothetical protein
LGEWAKIRFLSIEKWRNGEMEKQRNGENDSSHLTKKT